MMDNWYIYMKESSDTLSIEYLAGLRTDPVKPIIWAQDGRYGLISKRQVLNMMRRQEDLAKQQRGYAKDKPLDLVFNWDDTLQLDPITIKTMRKGSP